MSQENEMDNLVQDLQEMCTENPESGMYILCSGDVKVAVPKPALEKYSGYVRSMKSFLECSNETETESETHNNEIKLDNLSGELLHLVAEFINNNDDQVDLEKRLEYFDMDNVLCVLMGADFLDIPKLVLMCEKFLISGITLENYEDMWSIAARFRLEKLSHKSTDFVMSNFHQLSIDQCNSLSDEQMKMYLRDDRLNVDSEYDLVGIVKRWMVHNKGSKWFKYELSKFGYYRNKNVMDDSLKIFTDLMSEIRWPLIKPDDVKKMDSEVKRVMKKNPALKTLLTEAKDYHSNLHIQPFKQTKHTRVRSNQLSPCRIMSKIMTKIFIVHNLHTNQERQLVKYNTEPETQGRTYYFRSSHPTVIVVNNFLYISGSIRSSDRNIRKHFFRYDPRFDSWLKLSPMGTGREDTVFVSRGDYIFLLGGRVPRETAGTATCERFDIRRDRWMYTAHLPQPTLNHAACVHNNSIYVSGGLIHDSTTNSTTMYRYDVNDDDVLGSTGYDIRTREWARCARMTRGRHNHIMGSIGTYIYIVGGTTTGNSPTQTLDQYSPLTDQWIEYTHIPIFEEMNRFLTSDTIFVVDKDQKEGFDDNFVCKSVMFGDYQPESILDTIEGLPLSAVNHPQICGIYLPCGFWEKPTSSASGN